MFWPFASWKKNIILTPSFLLLSLFCDRIFRKMCRLKLVRNHDDFGSADYVFDNAMRRSNDLPCKKKKKV